MATEYHPAETAVVSALRLTGEPLVAGDRGATLREVVSVYVGSDGEATKALYARLAIECGVAGIIAVNLLRATKASERAKLYRGGIKGKSSYRSMAYDKKAWAMAELATALTAHGEKLAISWGWGTDAHQPVHSDVLYVDIPTGQVSFHTAYRGAGPDYPGQWDGMRQMGPKRVCDWAADLLRAAFAQTS